MRRRADVWILWAGGFVLALINTTFLNDHFDRITRARQMLVYGDVPFLDFQDPGYFLTLYASAAGLWLSGGGLLGEIVLISAALATAGAIAYALAAAAAQARLAGLIAFALTCVIPARAYDWDKALFYTSGLALMWGYADRPSTARLVALGVITAVAGMCRYDNGIYLFAATVPVIVMTTRRSLVATAQSLAIYSSTVALTLAPAAAYIEASAGLGEAARQVATYAAVEGERSLLLTMPRLGVNMASLVWLLIATVLVTAPVTIIRASRTQAGDIASVKVAGTSILLLCVALFVLRNPIEARVGAAVPLAAILAACVIPRGWFAWPRPVIFAASSGLLIALVIAADPRLLRAPGAVANRIVALTAAAGPQGPGSTYLPGRSTLSGLATYIQRCTAPQDRVLVAWFAPEIYFFTQRAFAGGMPVMFGKHWSSERDQRAIIERLKREAVPLIIMSNYEGVDLEADFPLLAEFLRQEYRDGGISTFGDRRRADETGYRVLVRQSTQPPTDLEWRVACPSPQSLSYTVRTVPFAVSPPIEPMLAKAAEQLPHTAGFLFEPKWDGFRAIVFKGASEVFIQSRDLKPLDRYFPELHDSLVTALPDGCVVDGEIVIATPHGLDFDALQLRLHPAASRVAKLAAATPSSFVAFDAIAADGKDLRDLPFAERRAKLELLLKRVEPPVYLTPMTRDRAIAVDWLARFEGAGLDGVIAKPETGTYEPGKRAMIKVKHARTADCVIAGFRWHKNGKDRLVGSLLLGLYDDRGVLQHVGVTSAFTMESRAALAGELAPLRKDAMADHPWRDWAAASGEMTRMPGGHSRWSAGKDLSWEPLRIERVCEVKYDHMQGDRFRHAAIFLRWRPDKPPHDCRYDQLEVTAPYELGKVFGANRQGG